MSDENIELVDVNFKNLEKEHICCAIGNSSENVAYVKGKKDWLKSQFEEGHRFKKADIRGKVFIEYGPVETSWAPLEGKGYVFIQCFWVSGRFKNQGIAKRLLEACEKEAKEGLGKKGVLAIAGTKKIPFVSDGAYLKKNGYKLIDTSDDGKIELLLKEFETATTMPSFSKSAKKCSNDKRGELIIYSSPLCPFVPSFAEQMNGIAVQEGFKSKVIHIDTLEKAKKLPSPFYIFSVFYDGKLVSNEPMPEAKWRKVLQSL